MRRSLLVAFLSTCSLSLPLFAQQPLVLKGATVHIGDGTPAIENAVVVVANGRFTAVGKAGTVQEPADARTLDLTGRHLAPGLIDTHVHYSQTGWADGRPDAADVRKDFPYETAMADNREHPERYHRAFLHAGVTAVFDVGGYPWTLALPKATEADALAPHVRATGPLLATYDPKLELADQKQFAFPKTADDARSMVKAQAAAGAQAIKFWYVLLDPKQLETWNEVLMATGAACRDAKLPLVVHATTLATAKAAVAAGASLLVHSVDDAEVDEAFVQACKQAGTSYCPTLTVRAGYRMLYAAKLDEEVTAQLDAVHPTVKARALATSTLKARNPRIVAMMDAQGKQQGKVMAKNVMTLHQAGVPIVMGTDAGNPLTLHGPSVFVEMEAMAAAGLTAREVLVASTHHAARAMGRDDLGRIAAGCAADLVVLPADPEQDVRAWRSLTHVLRAGTLHERAALLPR